MRSLAEIEAEAEALAASQFSFGEFRGVKDLVAVGLLGDPFGWRVASAALNFQIVNGRIGLRPEAMLSLARQAGHSISFETETEPNGEPIAVVAKGRRADTGDADQVRFSRDDAKRAKLSGTTWNQYPEAMLTWRATAMLARRLFSDVLAGVSYVTAELADIAERPTDSGGVDAPEADVVAKPAVSKVAKGDGVSRAKAKAALLDAVSGDAKVAGTIWDRVTAGLDLPTSASRVSRAKFQELLRSAQDFTEAQEMLATNGENAEKGRSGASNSENGDLSEKAPPASETGKDAEKGRSGASGELLAQEADEVPF